tara:strand:+ start:742 stop:1821 length:1080 start_codon:yes stop_codon:yes gene_type:complete
MRKRAEYKSFQSSRFRKSLLKWYKAQKRDLPWRKTKDPYKILISEIMLQQTQVETVIPYYKAWMKKFNTIKKLAVASLDEVLMLWEGMGYYSRARNLHLTAKEIVKNYNGKIPDSFEDLLHLPGIGKYTAGAIVSIAFNKPAPAIDANVKRVLTRLFCLSPSSSKDKTFWELALNIMVTASPSEFNQAMMEIGALICVAKNPRCPNCPVRSYCKAYSKGMQTRYPAIRKPKKVEEIEVVLGIIFNNNMVYIQKRPPQGLFAGLWEFPGGKVEQGESPEKALHRELKEELGEKVRIISNGKAIRHNYTRFKVLLHPFICSARKRFSPGSRKGKFRWISREELKNYAFPAANRKIIRTLME